MSQQTSQISPEVEAKLSALLRERTGYEIGDLDRDATFLELGFDSLFLIQFSMELQKRLGVKVSFRQLIEEVSTVDLLLGHLSANQPASSAAAAPAAATPAPSPAAKPASIAQPSPAPAPVATAAPSVAAQAPVAPQPAQAPPVVQHNQLWFNP